MFADIIAAFVLGTITVMGIITGSAFTGAVLSWEWVGYRSLGYAPNGGCGAIKIWFAMTMCNRWGETRR